MKFTTIIISIFFLLGFSILCNDVLADDKDDNKVAFVDLDGDGLNDGLQDDDGNGIPDQFHNIVKAQVQQRETSNAAFNMFDSVLKQPASVNQFLSNSQKFGKLKFVSRAITSCRGGLQSNEGFGESGIGSGAVAGGNCAGGVCRP